MLVLEKRGTPWNWRGERERERERGEMLVINILQRISSPSEDGNRRIRWPCAMNSRVPVIISNRLESHCVVGRLIAGASCAPFASIHQRQPLWLRL